MFCKMKVRIFQRDGIRVCFVFHASPGPRSVIDEARAGEEEPRAGGTKQATHQHDLDLAISSWSCGFHSFFFYPLFYFSYSPPFFCSFSVFKSTTHKISRAWYFGFATHLKNS